MELRWFILAFVITAMLTFRFDCNLNTIFMHNYTIFAFVNIYKDVKKNNKIRYFFQISKRDNAII